MLRANPGLADRILQNKAVPQNLRDTLTTILQNEPTLNPLAQAVQSIPIPL
jgi:hypothetical protein